MVCDWIYRIAVRVARSYWVEDDSIQVIRTTDENWTTSLNHNYLAESHAALRNDKYWTQHRCWYIASSLGCWATFAPWTKAVFLEGQFHCQFNFVFCEWSANHNFSSELLIFYWSLFWIAICMHLLLVHVKIGSANKTFCWMYGFLIALSWLNFKMPF